MAWMSEGEPQAPADSLAATLELLRQKRTAPGIPGGRPAMGVFEAALYDLWLVPNGINGYLDLEAVVLVDRDGITYDQWVTAEGEAVGWDAEKINHVRDTWSPEEQLRRGEDPEGHRVLSRPVTVPLVVPLTAEIRHMFEVSTLTLIER